MKIHLAVLQFCLIAAISTAQNHFNVKDYGAKADRQTNDAFAIQAAIEACAGAGGGVVYLPSGDYLTGPLFLKSNVNLHLEIGATLWAHPDRQVYFSNGRTPSSNLAGDAEPHTEYDLINGDNLENVAVTGGGTINGQGPEYWWGKEKFRPYILRIRRSKNVRFEHVTTTGSPTHTFAFVECDRVNIRDIALYNDPRSPNTDGIHLFGCSNVHISGVHMDTGDDCLVVGGGSNAITVTNCTFVTPWAVMWVSDGRGITLSNCVVQCQMLLKDIQKAEYVTVSNIVATGRGRLFSMMGGPARYITLSNVTAYDFAQAGWMEYAEDVILDNVKVIRRFGSGSPALQDGFEFRQITGLTLRNVEVRNVDKGPAILCDQVEDLELDGFRATHFPEGQPAVVLRQTRGAYVHECRGEAGTQFLRIEGEQTDNIRIADNDLNGASVAATDDVPLTALPAMTATTSQLTIPAAVHANDTIPVGAVLHNPGQSAGFCPAVLQINGQAAQIRWVWLKGGESRRIYFSAGPFYRQQEYQIGINEVAPLACKLSPQPARIAYLDLRTANNAVRAGTEIKLKARLKNIGSFPVNEKIFLMIGSSRVASQEVSIDPGEVIEVDFYHPAIKESLLLFSVDGEARCAVKVYEDPLSSTVLELDFERAGDGVLYDRSGLGHHALLKANPGGEAPAIVKGKIGNALRFNGESAYAEIPSMFLSYPMSISMWIRPGELTSSSIGGRQMILYAGAAKANDGFGPEEETHVAREAGDYFAFWNRPGDTFELRTKIEDTRKYYFLTVVYGDGVATLYINGEAMETKTDLRGDPDFSTYTDRIYLGRPTVDYLRYFNGEMDELKIYREVLSAEEVRELYESYNR